MFLILQQRNLGNFFVSLIAIKKNSDLSLLTVMRYQDCFWVNILLFRDSREIGLKLQPIDCQRGKYFIS